MDFSKKSKNLNFQLNCFYMFHWCIWVLRMWLWTSLKITFLKTMTYNRDMKVRVSVPTHNNSINTMTYNKDMVVSEVRVSVPTHLEQTQKECVRLSWYTTCGHLSTKQSCHILMLSDHTTINVKIMLYTVTVWTYYSIES